MPQLSNFVTTPNGDQVVGLRHTDSEIDAFGNVIRVLPKHIVDIKHLDSLRPELINEVLENGGTTTLNKDTASADMVITATVGSRCVRQTHQYYAYESGKSFEWTGTGIPIVGDEAGIRWRAGFFDDSRDKTVGDTQGNGLFFQYEDGIWSVVIRYQNTDTVIPQSTWNGDGAQTKVLDATKINIFWLDFGWLSIRGVRFGYYEGDQKIVLHDEEYTNKVAVPFIARATLPVRYEVENITGASTAMSKMICFVLQSYGDYSPDGVTYSVNNGNTVQQVADNNPYPLASVRLRPDFNRRSIKLLNVDVVSTTNANALVEVWLNSTPTGSAFSDVGNGSGAEFSTAATAVDTTNATLLSSGYISNNNDQFKWIPQTTFLPTSDIAGNSDLVTVTVTRIGGTNESFVCAIEWSELL